MKMMRKISALVLAIMMIAVVGAAYGATTLDSNGEDGAFTSPDTPVSQSKTLVLSKEIKAYNLDETTVKAPDISYTYAIGAATVASGTSITDKTGSPAHAAGVNVTVPVKAGIVTNVSGTNYPLIANSGVVAWSNTENLAALTGGDSNKKDISIDFSGVVFNGAGVYRYVITEALTSGYTYASSGVTETGDTTNGHIRYIDVYVRPSTVTTATTDLDPFNDGSTAREWDIYGFTCFYNNTSIAEGDKTTGAVKTTGFVTGTSDGSTAVSADSYYTFNLTVSKTVVNDGYGASNVAFPFTIIFTNSNVTRTVDIIGNIENVNVTGWIDPAASAMSNGTNDNSLIKGVANIKSGGQIKYIGIPNGTSVEVYETNIATGITYKVDTALTTSSTATTSDAAVISGTTPGTTATAQGSPKQDYQSTKATFTTTANSDDDNDYTVAITNTLLTISPTGVLLRVAPYIAMLTAGIALLVVFAVRRRRRTEDD